MIKAPPPLPVYFIVSYAWKPFQVKTETAVAMALNNHAQAFNIWVGENISILTNPIKH